MKPLNYRSVSARWLVVLGSVAMVVGAIDPMEGSVGILIGSGLVALGTFLGQSEPRLVRYRTLVLGLIAVGVGALWGLSWAGGCGGNSGHSMWWSLLVLPYLIGWSMGMWGPGSPRWLLLLGILAGLWYVTILAMCLKGSGGHRGAMMIMPAVVIGATGLVTIGGCISKLRTHVPGRQ
jgi:hypothetical protein